MRALAAVRVVLATCLLAMASAAAAAPQIAPAWQLKTPEGKTVAYPQDAQGRPTVLLFWPSWCPFSRALQPYVQDIWTDYRDAGVNVWTINIKETGDPVQAMRDRGLSFPLLLNGDDLIPRYGIERTPWFVVIDGQQRIVYTRPANPPTPIDVAKAARSALNELLGDKAVPLPERYPPPYDLHLRKERPSRQAADAAKNEEWLPWAERYLAQIDTTTSVSWIQPRGAVPDGKTAIAQAREIWSETYGAEQSSEQAPFRAFRRDQLWLVSGLAYAGRLGEGYIIVLDAQTGRVVHLKGEAAP